LDWVPFTFSDDAHGLGFFDGSNLFYEHPDRKEELPDWKSLVLIMVEMKLECIF
jgi:1,4-alpha-glucan branching enzyme